MEALPLSLLMCVLSHVEPRYSNAHRILRVCRDWAEILNTKEYWMLVHDIHLGGPYTDAEDDDEDADLGALRRRCCDHYARAERGSLQWAANNDHVHVMYRMLRSGSYSRFESHVGMRMLISACQYAHLDLLNWLLHEKDINPATTNGGSALPLAAACFAGHIEIVKSLLRCGCGVNKTTPDGSTALHTASCNGHGDIVRLLLSSGADVNATKDGGVTPLYLACYEGHFSVADDLLRAGAHTRVGRAMGITPLYVAAQNGHLDVVELLIRHDRGLMDKATSTQSRPQHAAAAGGHVHILEFFWREGFSLEVTKRDGTTLLHLAACGGHVDVIEWLLSKGANPCAEISGSKRETPLQMAVRCNRVEAAVCLIDSSIRVITNTEKAAFQRDLSLALLCALQCRDALQVRTALLAMYRGGVAPQPAAREALLDTLSYCAENDTTQLACSLLTVHLQEGVEQRDLPFDVNQTVVRHRRNRTSIWVAARHNAVGVMGLLLECGAEFESPPDGRPLHVAAAWGNSECVQLLLDSGADRNALCGGKTALEYAKGSAIAILSAEADSIGEHHDATERRRTIPTQPSDRDYTRHSEAVSNRPPCDGKKKSGAPYSGVVLASDRTVHHGKKKCTVQ